MEEKMNEELLDSRFGRENHFRTPEGYFDALPQRIMNRINRRKRRRTIISWSIAAIMSGIVVSVGFMTWNSQSQTYTMEADNAQYIEDALDYTMINNMEIATYLTEAE